MERCATCRHWKPPEATPWSDGFGTCMEIVHADASAPTDRAYFTGFDGVAAWLKTRPDFGCVQWEAKSDA